MKQNVAFELLQMQPTFVVDLPVQSDEVIAKLRQAIENPELRNHVIAAGPCMDFRIAPEQQRFWSPHLSIQIGEVESGSEIFGRFSPRPEIWTMFMAIYAVVLTVMSGATIFGYVQWSLGETPWSLVLFPIGLLIIASLHAASLVGQNLSSDQMDILRHRLDRAIEIAFPENAK